MRGVSVQGMHQRRSLQDQPNPRVAMTVNPTLVTLGQAKPTLQIEIIPDRFVLPLAHEQAGQEAEHHPGHAMADRIIGLLEFIDQGLELLLSLGDVLGPRSQRRGHLRDHLHVVADHLLDLFDFIETRRDASREPAELLLREPPFFAPKFRRSDSWTSRRASAIRNPGGSSGPPWSSLRMPRTAAQYSSSTLPAGSTTAGDGSAVVAMPVASAASGGMSPSLWAFCRRSTACSIVRRPRTFFRIRT